jgi:hypothetical protein
MVVIEALLIPLGDTILIELIDSLSVFVILALRVRGSRWESQGRDTCSSGEQRSKDSESDHYSNSNFTENS